MCVACGIILSRFITFHRCLAHIVHLSAKHIVQAFSETGPEMESDIPMDTLLADVDEDSETSYASGDTLGKLWAFINQVRVSCNK